MLIVLIYKLLINLCIKYKYVLLLQSTEKNITIFLSMGILEHSPLQGRPSPQKAMMHFPLFRKQLHFPPILHFPLFSFQLCAFCLLYMFFWFHLFWPWCIMQYTQVVVILPILKHCHVFTTCTRVWNVFAACLPRVPTLLPRVSPFCPLARVYFLLWRKCSDRRENEQKAPPTKLSRQNPGQSLLDKTPMNNCTGGLSEFLCY